MATKTLAQNYENRGVVRTNLLYDPTNGNVEIIEPGIGGRVLFRNGNFTDFGKQIYSDSEQKTVTQRMQNDLRAAQKTINNSKLQPWAQSQSNTDAAASANVNDNISGLEQFSPDVFGKKEDFKTLMYPKTMNPGQDRIVINQIQYKRSGILQREGDLPTLQDSVGSVILPMPNDISETNSVGWGEDSLSNIAALAMPGLVGAGLNAAEGNIAESVQKAFQSVRSVLMSGAAKERVTQFLSTKAAASVVQKFGVTVNPEAFITRSTGAAINPNLELLFNGPKLRQFGFQFKLTPRDGGEATEIRKILRFFKQGMSPRKGSGEASFFLGTPNVFKIQFKSGDSELKSIGKIKTCALVSFNANYTPDGFYAAYKDGAAGGSQPVAVTIQLGFTELTPIFNDEYDSNYDDIGPNVTDVKAKEATTKTPLKKTDEEPNIPGGARAGTVRTPAGGGSSTKSETIGTGEGGITRPVGGR